jgi:PAT family beta-lactamase induction signal transducer AmpG
MLSIYFHRPLLTLLALGFVSGVPFLLTLSTLSFWLAEQHVSTSIIGLFMLASFPYSIKFLWSPFLEIISIPFLTNKFGQRRSWGLLAQTGVMLSTIALAFSDPGNNLLISGAWAFLISFFSATQDVVTDSYRIDLLENKFSGAGAAMESIGFRAGMLASGAGTLYLANSFDWPTAYCLTALSGIVGIVTLLSIKESASSKTKLVFRKKTFSKPFYNFYLTYSNSWRQLIKKPYFLYIVAFIFCFKMADTVLNSMSVPFLYELGFSKIECANISKFFGITMMVSGGLVGGVLIHQLGMNQTIVMCATLQALSCLMFMIQAQVGHVISVLVITMGVESFCSGLSSTAFIAYLSKFCKTPFSASHFTLLYSLGSLSRVIISAGSGWFADTYGWMLLFGIASLFSIFLLYFLIRVRKISKFNS